MILLYWLRLRRYRRRRAPEPTISAAEALTAAEAQRPDSRALALLRSQCTEAQQATIRDRYLQVRGSQGGWYCIHWDRWGHVIKVMSLHRTRFRHRMVHTHSFCCRLRSYSDDLPLGDRVMAYKLGFETDEQRIRMRAQRRRLDSSKRAAHEVKA